MLLTPRCGRYRIIASSFEIIVVINYIIYFFYPLPVPIPRVFPWSWWISALAAALIAVPAGYLLGRGLKDAGREAMMPEKKISFLEVYIIESGIPRQSVNWRSGG